ncbi:predicted protein [Histoplasma mississippiense (nom. inval.)]|uniref:predicted protein n=1 Tax=Ajellomyces capsulatus (strain NAm1 / WU24) TaxID=2059318 RepID=UPI000157BF46|nr:predicted protein [Histoplasma mississippiense (nom. inval.)]EDN06491.1 predicted protein [Histoplasma mississippiense (nom. inval.)]
MPVTTAFTKLIVKLSTFPHLKASQNIMATSIRRVLISHHVVAIEILRPGFKNAITAAGNVAKAAIQAQPGTVQAQSVLVLPGHSIYGRIEEALVEHRIPKTLTDSILVNFLSPNTANTLKPGKDQIFCYRRGSFAFREFPITVLIPLVGSATIAIAPMGPDKPDGTSVPNGKPVPIVWNPGYYIVAYGPFDIQVGDEGGITLIVIGYQRSGDGKESACNPNP